MLFVMFAILRGGSKGRIGHCVRQFVIADRLIPERRAKAPRHALLCIRALSAQGRRRPHERLVLLVLTLARRLHLPVRRAVASIEARRGTC